MNIEETALPIVQEKRYEEYGAADWYIFS